jgi:hypothetical protein
LGRVSAGSVGLLLPGVVVVPGEICDGGIDCSGLRVNGACGTGCSDGVRLGAPVRGPGNTHPELVDGLHVLGEQYEAAGLDHVRPGFT